MGAIFSMFSKKWDPLTDMPDLRGLVAVMTGGKQVLLPLCYYTLSAVFTNSLYHTSQGLGYAIIKFLALAGAKVYMASRSEAKAKTAIEDFYRENPKLSKNNILFLKMDLANIKGIVASADEFSRQETRLDILGKRVSDQN